MNDRTVRVTRTLNATPQQVFEAWTDADHLRQWLVPGPGVVAEAECDAVVGGGYRFLKVTEEGVEVISGEYLEVDPPHRLVFTWLEEAHLGPSPTRVTVTLVGGVVDGRSQTTTMTIVHERLPEDIETKAPLVWAQLIDMLERLLEDGFVSPDLAGGMPSCDSLSADEA